MADRVGVHAGRHEHVVAAYVDVEAARVVGPEVERAARNEVEARVMPVTGDESGLDGALVERKAEVRAPVLDREGGVVVPEHDDGQRADLREEPPVRLQVCQGTGAHVVRSHGVSSFEQVITWYNLRLRGDRQGHG